MNVLEKFKPIKTFVFDVDGVLTDGSLLILEDGQMARQMNIKDGYALQLAIKQGYRVVIISGGTSDAVRERLQRLGVLDCFVKIDNKLEKLEQYIEEHQLNPEEILFMGDDIPDYLPMQLCGLPCCPADAATEIKGISHYISALEGGKGCARDVVEKVLKLNGHWPLDTAISSR
ncbi:MAG: HAD-IIIA family hydrolase [Chitinophagaceae bacterium]|nr:HAD-IIIA family hydrolase [Chitinophagaceae bacterium]